MDSLPPDENRGYILVVVQVVMNSIALFLVFLRCYQVTVVKKVRGDDICIILGMIFGLVTTSTSLTEVHNGLGRHIYYLTPNMITNLVCYQVFSIIFILLSAAFTKASICIFMLRLFQRQKTLTWLVYGTLLAIFLSYLINIIVVPAQCRPIQKIWDPSLPGNCWGPNVQIDTSYLQGAAAALIDLMLAFLPIYFLWDVQISTRVKLGICCLTGLGVFTAACAIGRTVLTSNVKGPDVSFDALNLTVWGVLEQTFAIIAACIPALRPLFISITQSFGTTFGFSTKKPSAYHSDGATRNRFVPLKSIHPTEGAFPSRHERQGNVSAKGSDSDNLSEQDLVSPLSDDHGGIRKTTQIRVTDY